MAYTTGDTILDDHYNGFVASINSIWGSGSGAAGYGQTSTLSTVSAGSTITATQWANLFSRVTSIANHQGTSITALTNPSAGDSIDAKANLDANITSLLNNKLNAASTGTDSTSTRSGTSTWYTTTTQEFTIDFGSDNEARYYFNAGGQLRMSSSRSGGTSNNKNTEWTDLCGDIGTVVLSGGSANAVIDGVTYSGTDKIGGGGATPTIADNTGFHDLTTSYVSIFKQFADTSPYTSNYIEISAKYNGSGTVSIKFVYQDAATDTTTDSVGNALTQDRVDGTLTSTVVQRQPETTYLTDTWGAAPSVTSTNSQS